MILPFVVEPSAMEELPGRDEAERALHRVLLSTWKELGVVVVETDNVRGTDLFRAIDRLHQSVRKYWKELLVSRRRFRKARRDWPGFRDAPLEDLRALDGDALLAIVSADTAKEAGVSGEQTGTLEGTDLELARFPLLPDARSIAKIRRLRQQDIPAGTTVREAWERWFLPHAELAQSVVVVDRYAGRQLVTRDNLHRLKRESGLARFLGFLERVPSIRSVKLIVAEGAGTDGVAREHVQAALQQLVGHTTWAALGTFEAYVVDDDRFKGAYHDRYVRFDSVRIQVGPGLEIFGGERLSRPAQYSVGPGSKEARKAARAIEDSITGDTPAWRPTARQRGR